MHYFKPENPGIKSKCLDIVTCPHVKIYLFVIGQHTPPVTTAAAQFCGTMCVLKQ